MLNITVGIVVRDGPSLSESSSARHGNVVMFSQCGPLFESSRRDETGYYAVTDSTRGDIILVTWSRHYLLSALYSPHSTIFSVFFVFVPWHLAFTSPFSLGLTRRASGLCPRSPPPLACPRTACILMVSRCHCQSGYV